MIPTYNFSDHIKGDTFNQKNINFGFDITDAKIEINFKTQVNSKTSFFWSTVDNSITITDGVNGNIILNSKIIDVAAGTYQYDLQITFADGRVRTYFNGKMIILQDVTE